MNQDDLRAARSAQIISRIAQERDELADLLREAIAPGGIGPREFSRPGGWRERAMQLLKDLE